MLDTALDTDILDDEASNKSSGANQHAYIVMHSKLYGVQLEYTNTFHNLKPPPPPQANYNVQFAQAHVHQPPCHDCLVSFPDPTLVEGKGSGTL